jgi:hypothetical protein
MLKSFHVYMVNGQLGAIETTNLGTLSEIDEAVAELHHITSYPGNYCPITEEGVDTKDKAIERAREKGYRYSENFRSVALKHPQPRFAPEL